MKKLIISLTLICAIFCTFDSCLKCYDESKCSNIDIEFEGFSCYQYENEYRTNECTPYPDDKKDQEAYWNMDFNFIKEIISSGIFSDLEDLTIYGGEKKTYNKGEKINTKKISLTPVDKEIISSKNTCLYKLFGRFIDNYNKNGVTSYPNVKDKTLCFNSDQFDEALNLFNCGYAEISFPLNGETYTMTTCFPFPNRKMPEKVQNVYNKCMIENQIASIKQLVSGESNKLRIVEGEILSKIKGLNNLVKITSEKTSQNEIRQLQSTNPGVYELVIENQYGKKYKYTNNVQDKPIVISEGNIEEEEKAEDFQRVNAHNYFKLNILFSLVLILML